VSCPTQLKTMEAENLADLSVAEILHCGRARAQFATE